MSRAISSAIEPPTARAPIKTCIPTLRFPPWDKIHATLITGMQNRNHATALSSPAAPVMAPFDMRRSHWNLRKKGSSSFHRSGSKREELRCPVTRRMMYIRFEQAKKIVDVAQAKSIIFGLAFVDAITSHINLLPIVDRLKADVLTRMGFVWRTEDTLSLYIVARVARKEQNLILFL
mmetsp:Transcript_51135/g.153643  ORF Transcript_51135/g.153643 Transcript_51135/m.153643 type:complete len:177 (-) Transcript_51135:38-568(-)